MEDWRTPVARVRYENVYPGINLVFYGDQGQLEYDFQVAPGADPAQAELEFRGADEVKLKDGALVDPYWAGERGVTSSSRVPGDWGRKAFGGWQIRPSRGESRRVRHRLV